MTPMIDRVQSPLGVPPTRRARPLVLVIEDDDDMRDLYRVALTLRGYAVVEAADGEEAVALAESERPDLILMDGSLPRLDGLGATRRIRLLGAVGPVPIVFVTGHAEPAFRAVAREAGCDEYLVKPFDLAELSDVIEKHLGATARPASRALSGGAR